MDMIRDRNEPINIEDLYQATMDIKEKHGYISRDLLSEYSKFDEKSYDELSNMYGLSSKFNKYSGYKDY